MGILQMIGAALLVLGWIFALTGSLGVLRLPDFYSRLHPAGMTDSFAQGLIVLGLCMYALQDLIPGEGEPAPDGMAVFGTLDLVLKMLLLIALIIFAEFFCSIALLFGFLTRLAVIPLIIGMSVAAFVAHAGAPFNGRELPLLYLAMYVVLLLTGPGKIALDTLIYNRFCPHSKKGKEA